MEQAGVSWTAWCADTSWDPKMFDASWKPLSGNNFMGAFVQECLAQRR
jgi:hypothetical protein